MPTSIAKPIATDLRQLASEVLARALKAGATDAEAVVYEGDEFSTRVRLGQVETLKDATAHAEMLAITQAESAMGDWRLTDCDLYVTKEPCPMCAGAIVQARIATVVYGAADPKAGACHTLYQITNDPRLNHRCLVIPGVLADRCAAILTDFFAAKRRLGKK